MVRSTILTIIAFGVSCSFAQVPSSVQKGTGSGVLFSLPEYTFSLPNATLKNLSNSLSLEHTREHWSGELASYRLQCRMKTDKSLLSLLFNRSGYSVSSKSTAFFNAGLKITDDWSLGAGIGLFHAALGDLKEPYRIGADLISFYNLSEDILIGSHIYYYQLFRYNLGVRLRLSDKSEWYIENSYNGTQVRWHSGLMYFVDSIIQITAGFQNVPARPSFGLLFHLTNISFNFSNEFHPNLGMLSSLSVQFFFQGGER